MLIIASYFLLLVNSASAGWENLQVKLRRFKDVGYPNRPTAIKVNTGTTDVSAANFARRSRNNNSAGHRAIIKKAAPTHWACVPKNVREPRRPPVVITSLNSASLAMNAKVANHSKAIVTPNAVMRAGRFFTLTGGNKLFSPLKIVCSRPCNTADTTQQTF